MKRSQATEPKQTKDRGLETGTRKPGMSGTWEWNLLTREYSWCAGMYRIFNLDPQQTPARTGTFLSGIHPEDRDKVVKALGKALAGEGAYDLEHRLVWPDGSLRLVHSKAAVTFNGGGRPVCIVGTLSDITEAGQTEEALIE